MVYENLKIALTELKANPFRSALTTLGIVIAVGAVITVVSIVQGASRFMLQQFESLGANSIWVWRHRPPGDAGRKLGRIRLTYEDARAIQARCSAVSAVSPFLPRSAKVTFRGAEASTDVRGTTPSYQVTNNWYPTQGRFFTEVEVESRSPVCVLGTEVLKNLDTTAERVLGRTVRLNGHTLRVVGIMEKRGALLGNSRDDTVLLPITAAFKIYGARYRKKIVITAQAKTPEETGAAVDQIRWLLRLRHGRNRGDPDDFKVFTQDEFLAQFQRLSVMVTGLLIGIVSVALLVGGIGIMNIMLVSVTERTREIGIRKALGAKNRDILLQFLIEAVALGALGGLGGIIGGALTGLFAREAISIFVDFPPIHVPLWSIGIAIGFSGSVGLISGIYPAWKAARLNPIEALRYD